LSKFYFYLELQFFNIRNIISNYFNYWSNFYDSHCWTSHYCKFGL